MNRQGILFIVLILGLAICGSTWAQSAAELLEKGIYTEETVGDLDAAIAIYDRIVKEHQADRPHVAQALYRLGQCYLKAGEEDLAHETFRELVDDYGEQTELVARAREQLPDLESWEVDLEPAPWADGERLVFSADLPDGRHLGDMTFSAFSKKVRGQDAWRLESYLGCPLYGIVKFMSVEARKDSLRPLASYLYHTNLGQARTEYLPGGRKMMLNRPGGDPQPFEEKFAQPVFDNEQNVFLVRRLPLAIGYEAELLFAGRPGATYTATIKVVGRTIIEVPAGEFDCFQVTISAGGRIETYWLTADVNRYLVQVRSPEANLKLTEIGRLKPGATTYRDEDRGFSLQVPAGWQLLRSAAGVPAQHGFAQLFAPEIETWGMFYSLPAENMAVRQRAEKQIADLKEKIADYTVREDYLEEWLVSGRHAVSFVTDFTLGGWKMTELQTWISEGETMYLVTFVTRRENFDHYREAIEGVLSSLELAAG